MEQRKLNLTQRLKDYTDVRTAPGEDSIQMLYVQQAFICSVSYAEAIPDIVLYALINATLEAHASTTCL